MINLLLLTFFTMLSLGQSARYELFSSVAILGYEVVMLVIVILAFILQRKKLQGITQKTHVKAFSIFVVILTFSLLVSLVKHVWYENIVAGAYLARLILYGLFFMTLFTFKKNVLEKGLKILTFFTLAFSLFQYIYFYDLRFLQSRGWDPHEGRVVGMFLDPTAAGIIFTLLFFYFIVRHLTIDHWCRQILAPTFVICLLFFLILLTYSRVTYVGFVSGLIYLLFRKFKPRLVLSVLIIFLICIPLLPRISGESTNLRRTYSINSRIADIQQGIILWQQHPMLGVGYNHIPALKSVNTPNSHSDSAFSSSFVTIMATSGLFGLGAFMYVFLQIFRKGAILTQCITIVILLTSLIENVFLLNVVLAVFLVLIALEDDR